MLKLPDLLVTVPAFFMLSYRNVQAMSCQQMMANQLVLSKKMKEMINLLRTKLKWRIQRCLLLPLKTLPKNETKIKP